MSVDIAKSHLTSLRTTFDLQVSSETQGNMKIISVLFSFIVVILSNNIINGKIYWEKKEHVIYVKALLILCNYYFLWVPNNETEEKYILFTECILRLKAMCSLICLFRWVFNRYWWLSDSKSGSSSNFIYFCGTFSGFATELQQCNMFPHLPLLDGQAWIKQEWLHFTDGKLRYGRLIG